jgi:glycosyltransferase involved in cell wall biosynthesis
MFHEPFGGVCAEALLSGCPVIASNFAAFVEHVQESDGILASGIHEFRAALTHWLALPVEDLATRQARRDRAVARWGYNAVALQYQAAFAAIRRNWDLGILPEGHPGR